MFWPTPDPTGVGATDLVLFLARWITHLCASGFFLIAGISLKLSRHKGIGDKLLKQRLLIRGLSLIALEFLFLSRWWFEGQGPTVLQVMWAFGVSMVAMTFFLKCESRWCLGVGFVLAMTGLHQVEGLLSAQWWRVLVGGPQWIEVSSQWSIYILYPVIPWFGLMLFGYGLPIFPWAPKKVALVALTALALFVALSYPLKPDTWMDWMRVAKYPPEPRFMLATIGILAVLVLSMQKVVSSHMNPLFYGIVLLGAEPLSVYVVHLPLLRWWSNKWPIDQMSQLFYVWLLATLLLIPVAWSTTKVRFLWREAHEYKRRVHGSKWDS